MWLLARTTLAAVVLLAPLYCAADVTPSHELRFVHPARTVYSLATDERGYLWAGTEAELLRTDGHHFDSMLRGPGLLTGSTRVFRVAGAKDGSLWVGLGGNLFRVVDGRLVLDEGGTQEGLFRWSAGTWQNHTGPGGMKRWIWSLLGTDDGSVWVGDSRCLRQIEGAKVTSFCEPQGLSGAFVYGLGTDDEGRLWGGTPSGVFHKEGDRLVSVNLNVAVLAVARAGQGRMWAATATGLLLLDRQGDLLKRLTQADGLAATAVTALAARGDGALWVGTSQGLSLVQGHKIERVAPALANTEILALQEDEEGSLWIGTRTMGLARFSKRDVVNVSSARGSADNQVRALLQTRSGDVWATTGAGLAHVVLQKQPGIELVAPPPAAWGPVSLGSLAASADGTLFVGSAGPFDARENGSGGGAGLLIYAQGQWRRLAKPQGLPADDVAFLFFDRGEDLWVGFQHGGLARLSHAALSANELLAGSVEVYDAAAVCNAPIRAGLHDNEGRYWFAADGAGVVRLEKGRAPVCLGREQGLKNLAATSVIQTRDGSVWVGVASDGGINRWDGVKFVSVDSSQGLPCDSIHSLIEGAGFLWATCTGGIERVALSELHRALARDPLPLAAVFYGVAEGMPAQTTSRGFFAGATLSADGQLLAATPLGVTLIEPPKPAVATRGALAMTAVVMNGRKARPVPYELQALGDSMDLTLEFDGPNFKPANHVAFAYKLENHDTDWHLSYGPLRQASYAALPPGAYTFRLRTFDGVGAWKPDVLVQTLRLRPALYKRLWVQLLTASALCALVALLLVWRSRKLHARYRSIQDERARIARDLHDHIGQAFASLAIHLDVLKLDINDTNKTPAEVIAGFENILHQTRTQTRKSIWRLRSQTLEQPSLDESIRALLRDLRAQFGKGAPDISLRVTGRPFVLEPHVVDEATQIAREALANSLTHGHAKHIVVDVDRTKGGVRLKVTDDGKGFDRSKGSIAEGHFGLIGMQERAIRAGGSVRVDSSPGLGTEVVLIVPEGHAGEAGKDR